ncbi:MAG: IS110 family transposase [Pseudonocardiaceae bacterium]
MTGFAGGAAQAGYMARVRDLAPQRCLVVPVDVGKHSAMALVADHYGQIEGEPFEFGLTVSGVDRLVTVIGGVTRRTAAESVRVGIEAAGHYHQGLATTLRGQGFDVVELNPYQVKIARAQLGQERIKTDLRDCMAMVELLVRGQGWPLHREDGAVAEQAALVAHRRRKLAAAQVLGSQILSPVRCCVPGPGRVLSYRFGGQGATDAAGHAGRSGPGRDYEPGGGGASRGRSAGAHDPAESRWDQALLFSPLA